MLTAQALEARAAFLSAQARIARRLEAAGCTVCFVVEDGRRDERKRFLVELLAPLDVTDLEVEPKLRDKLLVLTLVDYTVESGLDQLGEIYAQAAAKAATEIERQSKEPAGAREGEA